MPNTLLAVLALIVGLLQAWDSNALQAEPLVRLAVLTAVAIPPAVMLATRDIRARAVAVLADGLLLTAARIVSDVHMPELVLAAFVPAAMVLFDQFRTATLDKARPR